MQFLVKVVVSAVLIAGAAELGKRSTVAGAVLASLPLTSVLAMIWLHLDGAAPETVARFSWSIFFVVLPSLLLFVAFALLTKNGFRFWSALGISVAVTVVAYRLWLLALGRLGVDL